MASTWRSMTLGELAIFKTGKLDSNAAVANGDYPFFTCSQETLRTNTFSFDTECVLLAGNNANGIYPLKYYYGKFDAYQRTYVITPRDPNQLIIRFLYYALRQKLSEFRSFSTGAATKFLTMNILNRTEILVPPFEQQRRIASILGAYDDLIGVNRRRIALLEEMSRRLYEEWFTHFRFPGHEDHALARKKNKSLPDGWRSGELSTICSEIRDAVLPANVESNTPYVGLEHIPRRSTTLDAWARADEVTSTKLRFQADDVLFGKIRPYFHKVVFAPFEGVCSSDAIVIRSRSTQFIGLVLSITSSDSFVAHSVASSNGTKMPRANWSVLARTPIAIPPDGLMATFNKTIVSWAELAATLNSVNVRLAASRDLLLPRLISNEVSVSDPISELEAVA
jgi:type I restriction enzyme, S subunit